MTDLTSTPATPPSPPRATRGDGIVYRKTTRDPKTGIVREGRFFTMQLYLPALRRHRKRSSGTSDERVALRKLARWRAQVLEGTYVPDAHRVRFEELAALLVADYRKKGRRSLDRVEDALRHLRGFFGDARAEAIGSRRIDQYVTARQADRPTPAAATINRELAALRRMFRLSIAQGRLARRPEITLLAEQNVRQGFFDRDAFEAVRRHLPEALRPPITAAYLTGWRVKSELLTRHWRHVDLTAGWLRLDPGEGKTGEGRMFPLTPELRAVLDAQREETRRVERETGRIIPWVFHRDGVPIRDFRKSWHTACQRAGQPGRIPHDFRRTAVRNLERSGIPRSAAMAMVGHKTEAVYRRYAIVDEAMLREAGDKLGRLQQAQRVAHAAGSSTPSLTPSTLSGFTPSS